MKSKKESAGCTCKLNVGIAKSGETISRIVARGEAFRIFQKHVPDTSAHTLDIGCGSGEFLKQLKEDGYAHLSGQEANAYGAPPEGVEVKYSDLSYEPLPWPDNSFDAITAWEVFEHLENPYVLIREISRVLKPGGVLFVSMPNLMHIESRLLFFRSGNLWRWNKQNDHRAVFTPWLLKKAFAPQFEITETRHPLPMLGKYGILGRIRNKLRFLDRLLPANPWFGWFFVAALRKKEKKKTQPVAEAIRRLGNIFRNEMKSKKYDMKSKKLAQRECMHSPILVDSMLFNIGTPERAKAHCAVCGKTLYFFFVGRKEYEEGHPEYE